MTVSIYLPLLGSALFAVVAPSSARRLPPALATWLLTIGSVVAAAATTGCLALLALTLVGQSPLIARQGRWSEAALRSADPVAVPVASCALIVLLTLGMRGVCQLVRIAGLLRDTYQLAPMLPARGGELAVVDDDDRFAYAVPGLLRHPARIVVSSGLLRGLDADERRALLAHERSHLRHHHFVHAGIARLAAALNPMLANLPLAVDLAIERWADEDAARSCPRERVATALLHAAAGVGRRRSGLALGAAATAVIVRIEALRSAAPSLPTWRLVVLVAPLVGTAATLVCAAHDTERLFELAQRAYAATRP